MATAKVQADRVLISDLEPEVGEARELHPQDKARLGLAVGLLIALLLLVLLAGAGLLFTPASKATQAQTFFDFIKTVVPPLVTLVIGFYFRSESR